LEVLNAGLMETTSTLQKNRKYTPSYIRIASEGLRIFLEM